MKGNPKEKNERKQKEFVKLKNYTENKKQISDGLIYPVSFENDATQKFSKIFSI